MLDEFLQYIFGGDREGYFAVSLFQGGKPSQERFFRWPDETKYFTEDVLHAMSSVGDVYYTPSLFSDRNRMASFALGSWVAWIDCDQPPPTATDEAREAPSWPPAGLVVASGTPGRSHRYWRSATWLEPSVTVSHNKELAKQFHADKSGHDIGQLLRLPGSFNHKTVPPNPVYIVEGNLATISFPETEESIAELPTDRIQEVGLSVRRVMELDNYTQQLFLVDPPVGERSDRLFELACRLFENSWDDGTAKQLLIQADNRWKKFADRPDRDEQLDTLLRRARERTKPNLTVVEFGIDWKKPVSTFDLLNNAPKIEWVVPGMLASRGLMYLFGPTGVGKTTLSLNLAISIALQREEWLGIKLQKSEQRILFASHEMQPEELTEFLRPMTEGLTDEENSTLMNSGCIQFQADGAHHLDEPVVQQFYEAQLRSGKFTGLIVDTLGASIKTSLQDEPSVRKVADWIDRIRREYGIWVIMIAHPRKLPIGAKNHQRTNDDVYGSRIFADRASTVLILEKSKVGLYLQSTKTRFMGGTDTMFVKRNEQHWFEITTAGAVTSKASINVVGADELTTEDLKGEADFDF